jgi:crotonobetainyl-CoA:carnitine CoA-transferase CaiB-like acyl-CoA transferase
MSTITIQLPDYLLQNLKTQAQQVKIPVEPYIAFTLSRQTSPAYEVKPATVEEIHEQELRLAALRQSLGQPDMAAARRFLTQREQVAPESDLDPQAAALLRSQFE